MNIKPVSTLLVMALCALSSNFAKAETYGFYPNGPLVIGDGFDLFTISDKKSKCLKDDKITPPATEGAVSTRFEVALVKSHRDLLDKTQRDTSISAGYAFLHASASESSFNQYSFNSNSLTWILRAFSTFGTYELANPELKEKYRTKDDAALVSLCGGEIVTSEIRGAQVALIYHIDDVSESVISKLEQSFEAGVSEGALSTDVKIKYQQFFSRAESVSKISLTFDAIGGPGVSALKDIVGATDDVTKVEKVVGDYLATITASNAPPVTYFTADTLVGLAGRKDSITNKWDRGILGELYERYVSNASNLSRVRRALDQNGPYYKFLTPQKRERLNHAGSELISANEELNKRARECISGLGCTAAEERLATVDVSFLPRTPTLLWRRADVLTFVDIRFIDDITEIYFRPAGSSTDGATTKIWSADPTEEKQIEQRARGPFASASAAAIPLCIPADVRSGPACVVVNHSDDKFSLEIRQNKFVTIEPGATPVTKQLTLSDRFNHTLTVDLDNQKCKELTQCSLADTL